MMFISQIKFSSTVKGGREATSPKNFKFYAAQKQLPKSSHTKRFLKNGIRNFSAWRSAK